MGLAKTNGQRRKDAIETGRIDISDMQKKGRKTRLKSMSRSNKQDLFVVLLKHYLESLHKQFPNIEIVTGYNEYCILNDLEIDVPIIILHNDKVYKFALEYDGDIWHEKRTTDEDKQRMIKEKNWIFYRFEETNQISRNNVLLEQEVKRIVESMTQYIINN